MVQILQTITFFDTEKLVDWYYNHRIYRKFRFLDITGNKTPKKTVCLAILTRLRPATDEFWQKYDFSNFLFLITQKYN